MLHGSFVQSLQVLCSATHADVLDLLSSWISNCYSDGVVYSVHLLCVVQPTFMLSFLYL